MDIGAIYSVFQKRPNVETV